MEFLIAFFPDTLMILSYLLNPSHNKIAPWLFITQSDTQKKCQAGYLVTLKVNFRPI